jgi:hypothetical protein
MLYGFFLVNAKRESTLHLLGGMSGRRSVRRFARQCCSALGPKGGIKMSSTKSSCLFAALAAAAFVSGPTAANAGDRTAAVENHDGVYAVDIVTEQGSCDRIYHWTISISGGRISSPSDAMMQATGLIDPRGIVSVAFRRDNNIAHVAGRVQGRSGSGTWSSPTLQCGGSWRAARQS